MIKDKRTTKTLTLDQHDAEIRKPLEDEIKRLKFESENIQKAIQHVDEAKYNAQQDDIEFFVKQAKQEVVEELLRLINTLGIIRKSKSFVNGYDFAQEQIKQKLNEMKGGSDE